MLQCDKLQVGDQGEFSSNWKLNVDGEGPSSERAQPACGASRSTALLVMRLLLQELK
jgi:hypothetical protein